MGERKVSGVAAPDGAAKWSKEMNILNKKM
jgi:hypothetical protein